METVLSCSLKNFGLGSSFHGLFFDYIGKKVSSYGEIVDSQRLTRAKRLIHLTKLQDSSCYINPIGGASLYSKEFLRGSVELYFIKQNYLPYKQYGGSSSKFIEGLSIIDVMMSRLDEIDRVYVISRRCNEARSYTF